MKSGLELLAHYKIALELVRTAGVLIGDRLAVVAPAELPAWLEEMQFATEPSDLPHTYSEEKARPQCTVQLWTDEVIWVLDDDYGITRMRRIILSPEQWWLDERRRWFVGGSSMIDIADYRREQILETAETMFGTRDVEILRVIDVAWSGWECDDKAALVRLSDGRLEIVIAPLIDTAGAGKAVLAERIEAYRRLIDESRELIFMSEHDGDLPMQVNDEVIGTLLALAPPDVPAVRIVRTPGVMSGDLVVEGTRVRPQSVLLEILDGRSELEIIDTYPSLPRGVVKAVLAWAKEIMSAAEERVI